ncbi:NAD(P)-linked oxidoreductase superfamily protein [Rhynchospora pubera]|uniref:NAD(P)-linked oxidoreductase superfamily protein n=1 Tax=Rhynchospora pubera TaxID=906938 RepID=A0AAV8CEJ9_9POAL|nr:NAD(P)-linked oxidoreductase superfamily protein [Rhynchospora pubera]
MASQASTKVPLKTLSSGDDMPIVAFGTFELSLDQENAKAAIIDAIKIGYRHFDTACQYGSEAILGLRLDALRRSRKKEKGKKKNYKQSKLFTKLHTSQYFFPLLPFFPSSHTYPNGAWVRLSLRPCNSALSGLVQTCLSPLNYGVLTTIQIKTSLRNLKMDYLDLYLIHWAISMKLGPISFPLKREEVMPLDLKGVWEAMEECQKLGLTKSIGVSNFTTKKLEELLQFANIPPAVNQISLRWILEQGEGIVVKSFKKERLVQNLEIFNWELAEEERAKISSIPQQRSARSHRERHSFRTNTSTRRIFNFSRLCRYRYCRNITVLM